MFNWYQGRGSKGARTRIFLLEECNKQELQQRDNIIAIMKAGLADFLKDFTVICKNAIIDFIHDTKAHWDFHPLEYVCAG